MNIFQKHIPFGYISCISRLQEYRGNGRGRDIKPIIVGVDRTADILQQ